MIANYHTHTYRCHHASGTEREYIEKAIAEGLEIMGFSDHVPMQFPDGHQSGFRVRIEELEDYIRTLEALREEYKDRIKILIGFEAEYYPAYFDAMMELIAPYDYDYMILGQHFIDNEMSPYVSAPVTDEALLTRYVDQVLAGLATGKYTYLAHPDVYNFVGDEDVYYKHMKRLCEGCKQMDIPIEVNLLGLMGGRHYPSDRFYRIAGEVGNVAIIGCDAHHTKDVADPEALRAGEEFAAKYGLQVLETIELRDPKK
jgi:histidinol-phosphatase (PHP family)